MAAPAAPPTAAPIIAPVTVLPAALPITAPARPPPPAPIVPPLAVLLQFLHPSDINANRRRQRIIAVPFLNVVITIENILVNVKQWIIGNYLGDVPALFLNKS